MFITNVIKIIFIIYLAIFNHIIKHSYVLFTKKMWCNINKWELLLKI
jgi:hypothetical protein